MPQGFESPADHIPMTEALPCVACGYDLRGQPAAGVCPECAALVSEAVTHQLMQRDRALSSAPDWWLSAMQTGAIAMIVAAVLHVAAAAAPDWFYRWRSPQRVVALGLNCTGWVIGLYACWKLATPRTWQDKSRTRAWYTLRAFIVFYLLVPAGPVYALENLAGSIEAPLSCVLLLGLPLVGPLLLIRVIRLLSRSNATGWAVLASGYCPIIVLCSFGFLFPTMGRDRSSLALLMNLPVPLLPPTIVSQDCVDMIANYHVQSASSLSIVVAVLTLPLAIALLMFRTATIIAAARRRRSREVTK